jgi:hypothetical protein
MLRRLHNEELRDDQVEEDEVYWACSTNGGGVHIGYWSENQGETKQ